MINIIDDFPYKAIEVRGIKNVDKDLDLIEDLKEGDEIQISINVKSHPRKLQEFGGFVKEIKTIEVCDFSGNDTIRKHIILE